jgi:hypothetical protein
MSLLSSMASAAALPFVIVDETNMGRVEEEMDEVKEKKGR